VRRSPLAHRQPVQAESGAVRLFEQRFSGKLVLRADPADASEGIRSSLGVEIPVQPLTSATAADASLLWMGPDEWMLVTAPAETAVRFEKTCEALAGTHHQLVDVSDYYTIIEVAGPKARELLMKLTTLDLHPRAFESGMVTGSVFGRANATIWQSGGDDAPGGPAFRLFIRWSMADYLWCLLADAGREWGMPPQVPVKGEKLTVD
jgi:sarcosine oxidase subunit gamma